MNTFNEMLRQQGNATRPSMTVRPHEFREAGSLPRMRTFLVRAGRRWSVWNPRQAMFVPMPNDAARWHVAKRARFIGDEYSLGMTNPHQVAPGLTILRSPRGVTYLSGRLVKP